MGILVCFSADEHRKRKRQLRSIALICSAPGFESSVFLTLTQCCAPWETVDSGESIWLERSFAERQTPAWLA
jgi:hypothetical protein